MVRGKELESIRRNTKENRNISKLPFNAEDLFCFVFGVVGPASFSKNVLFSLPCLDDIASISLDNLFN